MLPDVTKETTYWTYVLTGLVRTTIFIANSYYLSRHHFKHLFMEIDLFMIAGIGSIVSYGAFTMSFNYVDGRNGSELLRSCAVAVYALLTLSMVYQIRSMLKFFPWTNTTIWIYKLVRVYAAIFYIITEVAIEERETDRSDYFVKGEQLVSNTRVLFVASTLHYLYDAFEKVDHRFEKFQKAREKDMNHYVHLNQDDHLDH